MIAKYYDSNLSNTYIFQIDSYILVRNYLGTTNEFYLVDPLTNNKITFSLPLQATNLTALYLQNAISLGDSRFLAFVYEKDDSSNKFYEVFILEYDWNNSQVNVIQTLSFNSSTFFTIDKLNNKGIAITENGFELYDLLSDHTIDESSKITVPYNINSVYRISYRTPVLENNIAYFAFSDEVSKSVKLLKIDYSSGTVTEKFSQNYPSTNVTSPRRELIKTKTGEFIILNYTSDEKITVIKYNPTTETVGNNYVYKILFQETVNDRIVILLNEGYLILNYSDLSVWLARSLTGEVQHGTFINNTLYYGLDNTLYKYDAVNNTFSPTEFSFSDISFINSNEDNSAFYFQAIDENNDTLLFYSDGYLKIYHHTEKVPDFRNKLETFNGATFTKSTIGTVKTFKENKLAKEDLQLASSTYFAWNDERWNFAFRPHNDNQLLVSNLKKVYVKLYLDKDFSRDNFFDNQERIGFSFDAPDGTTNYAGYPRLYFWWMAGHGDELDSIRVSYNNNEIYGYDAHASGPHPLINHLLSKKEGDTLEIGLKLDEENKWRMYVDDYVFDLDLTSYVANTQFLAAISFGRNVYTGRGASVHPITVSEYGFEIKEFDENFLTYPTNIYETIKSVTVQDITLDSFATKKGQTENELDVFLHTVRGLYELPINLTNIMYSETSLFFESYIKHFSNISIDSEFIGTWKKQQNIETQINSCDGNTMFISLDDLSQFSEKTKNIECFVAIYGINKKINIDAINSIVSEIDKSFEIANMYQHCINETVEVFEASKDWYSYDGHLLVEQVGETEYDVTGKNISQVGDLPEQAAITKLQEPISLRRYGSTEIELDLLFKNEGTYCYLYYFKDGLQLYFDQTDDHNFNFDKSIGVGIYSPYMYNGRFDYAAFVGNSVVKTIDFRQIDNPETGEPLPVIPSGQHLKLKIKIENRIAYYYIYDVLIHTQTIPEGVSELTHIGLRFNRLAYGFYLYRYQIQSLKVTRHVSEPYFDIMINTLGMQTTQNLDVNVNGYSSTSKEISEVAPLLVHNKTFVNFTEGYWKTDFNSNAEPLITEIGFNGKNEPIFEMEHPVWNNYIYSDEDKYISAAFKFEGSNKLNLVSFKNGDYFYFKHHHKADSLVELKYLSIAAGLAFSNEENTNIVASPKRLRWFFASGHGGNIDTSVIYLNDEIIEDTVNIEIFETATDLLWGLEKENGILYFVMKDADTNEYVFKYDLSETITNPKDYTLDWLYYENDAYGTYSQYKMKLNGIDTNISTDTKKPFDVRVYVPVSLEISTDFSDLIQMPVRENNISLSYYPLVNARQFFDIVVNTTDLGTSIFVEGQTKQYNNKEIPIDAYVQSLNYPLKYDRKIKDIQTPLKAKYLIESPVNRESVMLKIPEQFFVERFGFNLNDMTNISVVKPDGSVVPAVVTDNATYIGPVNLTTGLNEFWIQPNTNKSFTTYERHIDYWAYDTILNTYFKELPNAKLIYHNTFLEIDEKPASYNDLSNAGIIYEFDNEFTEDFVLDLPKMEWADSIDAVRGLGVVLKDGTEYLLVAEDNASNDGNYDSLKVYKVTSTNPDGVVVANVDIFPDDDININKSASFKIQRIDGSTNFYINNELIFTTDAITQNATAVKIINAVYSTTDNGPIAIRPYVQAFQPFKGIQFNSDYILTVPLENIDKTNKDYTIYAKAYWNSVANAAGLISIKNEAAAPSEEYQSQENDFIQLNDAPAVGLHDIVVKRINGEYHLYIDGTEIDITTAETDVPVSINLIGYVPDNYFLDKIYDLKIWEADVEPASADATNLIASYVFNEGYGYKVYDGVNDVTGEIVGDPTWLTKETEYYTWLKSIKELNTDVILLQYSATNNLAESAVLQTTVLSEAVQTNALQYSLLNSNIDLADMLQYTKILNQLTEYTLQHSMKSSEVALLLKLYSSEFVDFDVVMNQYNQLKNDLDTISLQVGHVPLTVEDSNTLQRSEYTKFFDVMMMPTEQYSLYIGNYTLHVGLSSEIDVDVFNSQYSIYDLQVAAETLQHTLEKLDFESLTKQFSEYLLSVYSEMKTYSHTDINIDNSVMVSGLSSSLLLDNEILQHSLAQTNIESSDLWHQNIEYSIFFNATVTSYELFNLFIDTKSKITGLSDTKDIYVDFLQYTITEQIMELEMYQNLRRSVHLIANNLISSDTDNILESIINGYVLQQNLIESYYVTLLKNQIENATMQAITSIKDIVAKEYVSHSLETPFNVQNLIHTALDAMDLEVTNSVFSLLEKTIETEMLQFTELTNSIESTEYASLLYSTIFDTNIEAETNESVRINLQLVQAGILSSISGDIYNSIWSKESQDITSELYSYIGQKFDIEAIPVHLMGTNIEFDSVHYIYGIQTTQDIDTIELQWSKYTLSTEAEMYVSHLLESQFDINILDYTLISNIFEAEIVAATQVLEYPLDVFNYIYGLSSSINVETENTQYSKTENIIESHIIVINPAKISDIVSEMFQKSSINNNFDVYGMILDITKQIELESTAYILGLKSEIDIDNIIKQTSVYDKAIFNYFLSYGTLMKYIESIVFNLAIASSRYLDTQVFVFGEESTKFISSINSIFLEEHQNIDIYNLSFELLENIILNKTLQNSIYTNIFDIDILSYSQYSLDLDIYNNINSFKQLLIEGYSLADIDHQKLITCQQLPEKSIDVDLDTYIATNDTKINRLDAFMNQFYKQNTNAKFMSNLRQLMQADKPIDSILSGANTAISVTIFKNNANAQLELTINGKKLLIEAGQTVKVYGWWKEVMTNYSTIITDVHMNDNHLFHSDFGWLEVKFTEDLTTINDSFDNETIVYMRDNLIPYYRG